MTLSIIQERLNDYKPHSKQEEENAFKEICQEIALSGLSRSGLFNIASFQGGTCLRIVYGLERFSEDMDFLLNTGISSFNWNTYLDALETEFHSFGLNIETIDRSEAPGTVKKAFLKEDSFGKVLILNYARNSSDQQKIQIKLEIDTNAPLGSSFETHYLNYPYPFSIVTQDKESLFAGKCHALLCREYVKGRDWFDFLWYVQKKIQINYEFLQSALNQQGPFKGAVQSISKEWVLDVLRLKVESIDWKYAVKDLERFIALDKAHILKSWNKDMFLSVIDHL